MRRLRPVRIASLLAFAATVLACGGGGGSGDGAATLPEVSVAGGSVAEGDVGTTLLDFTLTLTAAADGEVSVVYATSGGTADPGTDFASTSGTLVIPAGETTAVIPVPVQGDGQAEDDETIVCTLRDASGATLGAPTAAGTIEDDDPPAQPTLQATAAAIQTIAFSWAAVPHATHYRLRVDPDGASGFTQVGADLPGTATSHEVRVAVHLTDWVNARYDIQACNDLGCTSSAPLSVLALMLATTGYVKASNTGAGDNFGYSVAVSEDGDTLAVGAYFEASSASGVGGSQGDDSALESGAVYVFQRAGTTWTQQAYLKASNTDADDLFGSSVALSASGNTLAVGAYGEASSATGVGGDQSDDEAAEAGAVYVFQRAGATWVQQAYVKASNTDATDQFGVAVALSDSGDTLAVGAYLEDSSTTGVGGDQGNDAASGSGAVYVFQRAGATWTQQAYVKASNTNGDDRFGASVALSHDGDTLAVGAIWEDSSATGVAGTQGDDSAVDSGAVYVFVRAGTSWAQQAYVKASNTGADDRFGNAVALSDDGDTLVVGAMWEDCSTTGVGGSQGDDAVPDSGAVYVFQRTGTAWSQQVYLKASNTGASDSFGRSVALSDDASILAVGATWEQSSSTGVGGNQGDDSADQSGAVYVFERIGATWTQRAYVKAPNAGAGDQFGYSVALSAAGDTLAVSAYLEASDATGVGGDQGDDSASQSGAVYIH